MRWGGSEFLVPSSQLANFQFLDQQKVHAHERRSRHRKKIEKVDILLSEANFENGPSEPWPCLLVKNTIFKQPTVSGVPNPKGLGRRRKSAFTARRGVYQGVFELKKTDQTNQKSQD